MGRLLYEIAEEIHMSIHVPAQVNAFFSIVPHMIYRTTARQDPDLKIHCGWEALKPVPQTNGKPSPATVSIVATFSIHYFIHKVWNWKLTGNEREIG